MVIKNKHIRKQDTNQDLVVKITYKRNRPAETTCIIRIILKCIITRVLIRFKIKDDF